MHLPIRALLIAVTLPVILAVILADARGQGVRADDREDRPWLGINISRNGYLGVMVTDVIEDTPAEACGLEPGDEILDVGGVRVADGDELIAAVLLHQVGDRVRVTYLRNGQSWQTVATLSARIEDRNELLHRRLVSRPVPAITAIWIDDSSKSQRHVDNDDLRGDVVLLLLWSTACSGCDELVKTLADFAADQGDGVFAFALSDETAAALAAYQQRATLPLPIATDADSRRRFSLTMEPLWQPAIVVIDHRGVVRFAALDVTGDHSRVDDALLAAERALRERARNAR
jgi:peroxiredoxin